MHTAQLMMNKTKQMRKQKKTKSEKCVAQIDAFLANEI